MRVPFRSNVVRLNQPEPTREPAQARCSCLRLTEENEELRAQVQGLQAVADDRGAIIERRDAEIARLNRQLDHAHHNTWAYPAAAAPRIPRTDEQTITQLRRNLVEMQERLDVAEGRGSVEQTRAAVEVLQRRLAEQEARTPGQRRAGATAEPVMPTRIGVRLQ